MSRLAIRNAGLAIRSAAQILTDLRDLTRTWAEARPDGVCDAPLVELLAARPELKERE